MSRSWGTYITLFGFAVGCALFGFLVGCALLPFTGYRGMQEPAAESSYVIPPRSRLTCPRANAEAFVFTNEYHKPITVHFTGAVTCAARSLP